MRRCVRRAVLALLAVTAATAIAAPPWQTLDAAQGTLTRAAFTALIARVYAPDGRLDSRLIYSNNAVAVYAAADTTSAPLFTLTFAAGTNAAPPAVKGFRDVDAQRASGAPPATPLRGLRIALDPGHIGGEWARMEERWFWLNHEGWPVQEAALNRYVALLLRTRLHAAGAEVYVTRETFDPATPLRPDDFRNRDAIPENQAWSHLPELFREAGRLDARRQRREFLFYRNAEIEARVGLIHAWHPDLTLCLHFNATGAASPTTPTPDNRLLFLIHGNYLPGELKDQAQLFDLFRKLLEGSHDTERGVAMAIAAAFVEATGLPPTGGGEASRPIDGHPYIHLRNLAANRLFDGPVVYLEPYFQNNAQVYARIQMGDYDGTRVVDGQPMPSLFREYADAAAAGLLRTYTATNPPGASGLGRDRVGTAP